ncbi:McrB family protein [Rhabdothermincola salaria]|uniref:McrB family protein n=1 Tax=Rhabdothermincola salaria TaxID=2903142 RepID=UPI001E43E7BA|nr:AAA family ATPase [Rhabdothermincola salaria]MCD9625293.1 AAA family ATPase [Rhabdothermincola salaria]
MIDEEELGFRRTRFVQIVEAMHADAAYMAEREISAEHRRERAEELLQIVDALRADRSITEFQSSFADWTKKPGYEGLAGVTGGMFVNQLVKQSQDEDALTELLIHVLAVPSSEADAIAKLDRFIRYVESIKKGAHPGPKRALFFASFFWFLQDADTWPCLWASAEKSFTRLGWLDMGLQLTELYQSFRELSLALGDSWTVESALYWFNANPWVGLDLTLQDRFRWGMELNQDAETEYPDGLEELARANAAAVVADVRILGDVLESAVSDAAGRPLRRAVCSEKWTPVRYRANAWVDWRPKQVEGFTWAPGIRVFVTVDGALVGLYPGRKGAGWFPKVREAFADLDLPDLAPINMTGMWGGGGIQEPTEDGEFMLGKGFQGSSVLGDPAFADEVVRVAAQLQPALGRLMDLAAGERSGPDKPTNPPDEKLAALFQEFLVETSYPTPKDQDQKLHRDSMAALLEPSALLDLELDDFRRIYNSSHYGFPGFQSILNTTLMNASPAMVDRMMKALDVLLWGDAPVEDRIDRLLDPDDLGLKGLGEGVIMKMLALTHPERFIPVYPLRGDNGKAAILNALGRDVPDPRLSRGTRQVQANDALRALFDPFLPDDPWGQMVFAFWLRDRLAEGATVEDPLERVAKECHLPNTSWLEELVELLDDKRQIVLYGPPGTGKTYLARKLAEALAPDDKRRSFVQFHPSTSYEDFFEGYRPVADASGNLSYQLQAGPLAGIAEHAAQDSKRHLLVIDELNRANVPKVFGELLFLLEYRDETVVPLYRPEGFALPGNLWIIATMNTADRSIASLDAALRRRFHFVPIFPDDGPMEGVLERYLEAVEGDTTWADVVAMVNDELRTELGNGDQLIGHSHFMRAGLDEAQMAKIWKYNIDPWIEDLFYGDDTQIRDFRWPSVLSRYRAQAAVAGVVEPEGGAVTAGSPALPAEDLG